MKVTIRKMGIDDLPDVANLAAQLGYPGSLEDFALVVDEKIRGRGAGRLLLEAAEDWARSKGMKVVRLRSNVTREDAHRFYLREGYQNPKSWKLFVKQLNA